MTIDLAAIAARWDDPADRYWLHGNGEAAVAHNRLADEATADIAALLGAVGRLRGALTYYAEAEEAVAYDSDGEEITVYNATADAAIAALAPQETPCPGLPT